MSYTYDAANRITSITYPSGAVITYTRDTMGRITAVNAQPPGGTSTPVVSNVAHEPFGPYSALTYGNGVSESRGFDQDYRLTGITDTGTSTLENLSYGYYPTNNVHTITDAVNSGNSQTFSYDNLQRLTQATGGYGSYGYTYDNDGNRLTQALGGVTTNYGYGTANDLLTTESAGGTVTQTIGYTTDGRIASLSPGIQAPGGQYITSLSYNQDAQLSAVNAAGGALASYTYDAFGQRLIKTISGTNGEIYQYGQNGMLLEETNASGVAQADYIYLNGTAIATLDPSTGALYFLNDDSLGTPQLATDSSQAVAWQATYQPFGQGSVSGTITQNLRFPGQYFDSESGWNHNGFRDYIPDLGRYAEPDPLGLGGDGVNLYVYVDNNPIVLGDLMGLCPHSKRCIIAALEAVIRAGEDTNGSNGYDKLTYGKVIEAAPPYSDLVGKTGTRKNPIIVDTGTDNGFPNIAVRFAPHGISHAFGAYQFMPATWQMFGGGSDISPSAQDAVAANMLEYYDAVQPAKQGNLQQAFWNMYQWASMPDSPYPQRHLSMKQATDVFNKAVKDLPECH